MSSSLADVVPRRDWAASVANVVIGLLRRAGVSLGDLSEESLLCAARRRTGLSDFGDPLFLEGLRAMLQAFRDEAEASPLGWVIARTTVLEGLCNRLWINEEFRRNPQVAALPVRQPLIIASLPRSGTSFLYNLLAQDPLHRPMLAWEAAHPGRRPAELGRQPDPRIRRMVRLRRYVGHVMPGVLEAHPVDPTGPEECLGLLRNSFLWTPAIGLPSYRRWLYTAREEIQDFAYREYRQQLQLLQWQRATKGRWLLKSPTHAFALDPLARALPDVCLIQVHRDPDKVVASLCGLYAAWAGAFCDGLSAARIGPEVLAVVAKLFDLRRRFLAGPGKGRLLDIRYDDLIRDPLGMVRRIYERFDIPLTGDIESPLAQWLHNRAADHRSKRTFRLEQFGLTHHDVDQVLGSYRHELESDIEKQD